MFQPFTAHHPMMSATISNPATVSGLGSRLAAVGLIAILGVGVSMAAHAWGKPDGPIPFFYWGILPGAPFVLLAAAGCVPRLPLPVLIGAALGGLAAVAIQYGGLLLASTLADGRGGANIGMGLLLLLAPATIPAAMTIGGLAGRALAKRPR